MWKTKQLGKIKNLKTPSFLKYCCTYIHQHLVTFQSSSQSVVGIPVAAEFQDLSTFALVLSASLLHHCL